MATTAPPTQPAGDNNPLTKPLDWAMFMVSASICVSNDHSLPTHYPSPDAAKLGVLTILNRKEALGTYQWPDFAALGFDFAQSMRLRRALVHDTFVALQKNGNVSIGVAPVGTPDSARHPHVDRGVDTFDLPGNKRRCPSPTPTSPASSIEDVEDSQKELMDDENFLAKCMRILIGESYADLESYLEFYYGAEGDVEKLVSIVYDGLVEHWDGPQAEYSNVPEELERKHLAWMAVADTQAPHAPHSSPELGTR